MSHSTALEARQLGISSYTLATRSIVAASTLSSGAIAAITVAGSVFIFLLMIGPLLIYLSKRQDHHRAATIPASSLLFVEHGQFVENGDIRGPRRLRKKIVASDPVAYPGIKNATPIGAGGDSTKHFSLPSLPSVFSRPGSWRISGPLPAWEHGAGDDTNGNTCGNNHSAPGRVSPEKHHGYTIYQNRRKTSWIDEDALHGPRISPKKHTNRKSSWFQGNELTRTLSRHLSFRRFGAPELARSPTLPCIETNQEKKTRGSKQEESLAHRRTRSTENSNMQREAGTAPRFPARQPVQQGGSLSFHPRAQPIRAALPNSQGHSNTVINAAQQLAGRARVPSISVGVNGQGYSRFPPSNTDADLQAMLRRTAEKLQDGNRSSRRQTLMLPVSSSSSRWSDQPQRDRDPECGCTRDRARTGDGTPSPARSQKSAPAAVSYSELEGCSPRAQRSALQTSTPWQTHRRTITQHIPHISPLSMRSEPDNMAETLVKYSPKRDNSYGLPSSPSHIIQTPHSYSQKMLNQQTYSPASEKSSALSTIYSRDENSPPNSAEKANNNILSNENEMERRAMTQALRACDAFDGGSRQRDNKVGNNAENLDYQRNLRISYNSRAHHIRGTSLEQAMRYTLRPGESSASAPQGGRKQPIAAISPKNISKLKLQSIKVGAEDPFTTYTTPTRQMPTRLSQVFSPVPAELPGDTMTPSGNATQPIPETPTPSPSHRRIIPPPYQLRPVTSSPTLGHSPDPELQIQPPSREPSPAVSESGLSSVYDSYRYSRYSDSLEGSQAMSRISATTMLTVPPTEASPDASQWDEDTVPSLENRHDCCRVENGVGTLRSTNVGLNNVAVGAGAYTHFVGALKSSVEEMGRMKKSYTMANTLPHPQQPRQISLGNASNSSGESAYSQDEDRQDRLGPLMPFHPATATKHGMRVTSAVAELRRMNSQVSCVSGYSTATTNIAGDVSPTLPALRGGGFSPGKKSAGGGAKNYLSLGKNSPVRGDGGAKDSGADAKRGNAVNEKNGNESNATVMMPGGISDAVTLRRGGQQRSRGSMVVERFEQDLDHARQVLRESRGYNLQATPEAATKNIHAHRFRTHGSKLSQEGGRTSVMGLGLYDNKGFLRSSVTSKDMTDYV
ncbi:hypothetical protein F5B22DRAFT_343750 [Xylaria bambusicola]|uniref:uncharacterized protein n=1 Tax=Xylaria bambusicola TaxID=326684 RepID=UPI0020076DDD|nr:uncharacterized protein F5B22DRAFT_343750 [Xylaria bambusicola]KAI0525482.1 hypothetical protein F5B22DRAFT_343750 [Xylaria bambusicola]